jgi:hypothetical protein
MSAEKTQQIILKTDNLDLELQKNMVVTYTDTVNLNDNSVNPDQLWNCLQKVSMQYPYDSSKEICTHKKEPLEVSEFQQTQQKDKDKHKWIPDCHDSVVMRHPEQATTYHFLSWIHSWIQIRQDVDRNIRNCHFWQQIKATHGITHRLL